MSADKFRIDIYKEVTLIGRKTISAVFQFIDSANLTAQKQSKFAETEGSLTPITGSGEQPLNSNLFHMSCGFIMAIIISFFSVVLLFLPLDGDISSNFPQYLHVSHQLKLLAAFVLGEFTLRALPVICGLHNYGVVLFILALLILYLLCVCMQIYVYVLLDMLYVYFIIDYLYELISVIYTYVK
jgi:hypothetical protein